MIPRPNPTGYICDNHEYHQPYVKGLNYDILIWAWTRCKKCMEKKPSPPTLIQKILKFIGL